MVVYAESCPNDYVFHGVTVTSNLVKYLGTYIGKTDATSTLNLDKAIEKMCKTAQK